MKLANFVFHLYLVMLLAVACPSLWEHEIVTPYQVSVFHSTLAYISDNKSLYTCMKLSFSFNHQAKESQTIWRVNVEKLPPSVVMKYHQVIMLSSCIVHKGGH